MNDTRVPLLFAAISHWLIGSLLRLRTRLLDALGRCRVWIGLSVGTAICRLPRLVVPVREQIVAP